MDNCLICNKDSMKSLNFLFFEGIAFLILGILALVLPWFFTLAFTIVLGWILIVAGIVTGIRMAQRYKKPGFVSSLLATLLLIAVGIILIVWPTEATDVITLILSIFFFLEGLFKIFLAIRLRGMGNSLWVLLSGIVSIAIAAIIWVGWPETAHWFIGLLIGINLIFFGLAQIAFAWSAR